MRDVRLVAQSGSKPPSVFDLDAKREVERELELDARPAAPAGETPSERPAGFDPATDRASAPSPVMRAAGGSLQTRASDASSMASSGTPAASAAGAEAAEAAKAAAKAAKEARKAAHLAEMEKKGAAAAPKAQLTRAERRAQQEAQKAAKAAKKEGGGDFSITKKVAGGSAGDLQKVATGDESSSREPLGNVVGNPARQAQRVERAREAKASAKAKSKHALSGNALSDHFSHLRPYDAGGEHFFTKTNGEKTNVRRASVNFGAEKPPDAEFQHPAVSRVARLYADGTVSGGRARCAALLHTLKKVVESFEVPPDETYAHALTARVNAVVQHIQSARPMSVSMGNAVKSLKTHLARMSEERASDGRDGGGGGGSDVAGSVDHASDFESRRKTMAHLEYFQMEKIEKAGRSIAEHGANEIADGDVVATYGLSHHAFEILKEARRRGRSFGVAVIDSRDADNEGLVQLRKLRRCGIECTYSVLTGLDYVLRKGKVTKVLLGAAAVLANGAVVSRCGAAIVAASAVEYGIPVLVAAETCKFHERVQLDAVAHNELGDPDAVAFGASGREGRRSARTRGETRAAVSPARDASGDKNDGSKNDANAYVDSGATRDAGDASGQARGSARGSGGSAGSPLAGWRSHERLSVLNLKYDSTPASCVRAIVCESGAVAPTDVPSFLR